MKRFFFGPVLSRRLNFSLGIDILPDAKYCTFDCLYCEIGRTKRVESPKNRSPFYSELKKDFELQLRNVFVQDMMIDNLTFAGYSGEPTLNSDLESFLEITKRLRSEYGKEDIPITILTNSSTITIPEIRKVLKKFDAIVAKLDAGNQASFLHVNRPHYLVPPISEIIDGLASLKQELDRSKLIIQTLLIEKNSNRENIESLLNAYNKIIPDAIQLYSIARYPAYPVRKLDDLELERVKKQIQKSLNSKIKIKTY